MPFTSWGHVGAIVQDINDTLNVEGLCRAFPQRLQKLVDRDGHRISH